MNTSAPPLLPIFKSEAQARILAWLLLDPTREQPISSLSSVGGVSQPSALKEVNRLVEAALLRDRRAGHTRMVRANTNSPYYEPLVAILSRSYGPVSFIPGALIDLAGVEQVLIVGSWAERFNGKPGPPPRDVDVVVVGNPSSRALRAANRELQEQLDQPVQLTAVPSEEWATGSSGFAKTARSRPHVLIVDNRNTLPTDDGSRDQRPTDSTVTEGLR